MKKCHPYFTIFLPIAIYPGPFSNYNLTFLVSNETLGNLLDITCFLNWKIAIIISTYIHKVVK